MENGMIIFEGKTDDGIDYYLQSNQYDGYKGSYSNEAVDESGFVSLALVDKNGAVRTEFGYDELIIIKIRVQVVEKHLKSYLSFRVLDKNERIIFTSEIKLISEIDKGGVYEFDVDLPQQFLVPNKFKLTFGMHIPNVELIDYQEQCLSFEVVETGSDFHIYGSADYGCVFINCNWNLIK